MIHTVKGFRYIKCTEVYSTAISYIVINNVTYIIDWHCLLELLTTGP